MINGYSLVILEQYCFLDLFLICFVLLLCVVCLVTCIYFSVAVLFIFIYLVAHYVCLLVRGLGASSIPFGPL